MGERYEFQIRNEFHACGTLNLVHISCHAMVRGAGVYNVDDAIIKNHIAGGDALLPGFLVLILVDVLFSLISFIT